jgi:Tat protein secretion system quality control protein TatD with DNase activity
VIEALAEVKNITVVDVADQIAKNFESFFGIKVN